MRSGAIVWKTDDPALRKRMEQTYNRDGAAKRRRIDFELSGALGSGLTLVARDGAGRTAAARWDGPLAQAVRCPLTAESAREQLGRLGDTPFELGAVHLELPAEAMVPKSVLNELRRQAVAALAAAQDAARNRTVHPAALDALRQECAAADADRGLVGSDVQLHVLARTREQLEAVIAWRSGAAPPPTLPASMPPAPNSAMPAAARPEPLAPASPGLVYCDFEDVRRYREAVALAHARGQQIGLATLRILKPGEEGLLAQIAHAGADAVLIRNLAALAYFQDRAPQTALIGDFSLNVANELAADLFFREGMPRLVPSYDANWEQLAAMLRMSDPGRFEIVVHQHMPMFHMEHCVFAALLSSGKDWRDCGRPCDRHQVALRDRTGADFPLAADTGCRNTVFNSVAQSAAEFIPRMIAGGVRHFRVELLRESAAETVALLDRYNRVVAGLDSGRGAWRQLQVLNQLGVTRGTLEKRS